MTSKKNIKLLWIKSVFISKKEFDSKPVYNNDFLKTNIKSLSNEVTDFSDKEIPKAGSNHTV